MTPPHRVNIHIILRSNHIAMLCFSQNFIPFYVFCHKTQENKKFVASALSPLQQNDGSIQWYYHFNITSNWL